MGLHAALCSIQPMEAPMFHNIRIATLTLLIHALPSAHYGLIRLLIHVHARRAACRLPEPARHTSPGMDETSQVPRKERLHVHKVSDCARFAVGLRRS